MIAFFLTMPISRMMPISAMTLSSMPATQQRQERADAGRRQRGEDRHGMDVALVEHAEDDIDRDQRRQDQQRLVRERGLEGLRGALEAALDARRQAELPGRLLDRATAAPSDMPGARSKESVTDGKLPLVADRRAAPSSRSPASPRERHGRRPARRGRCRPGRSARAASRARPRARRGTGSAA